MAITTIEDEFGKFYPIPTSLENDFEELKGLKKEFEKALTNLRRNVGDQKFDNILNKELEAPIIESDKLRAPICLLLRDKPTIEEINKTLESFERKMIRSMQEISRDFSVENYAENKNNLSYIVTDCFKEVAKKCILIQSRLEMRE